MIFHGASLWGIPQEKCSHGVPRGRQRFFTTTRPMAYPINIPAISCRVLCRTARSRVPWLLPGAMAYCMIYAMVYPMSQPFHSVSHGASHGTPHGGYP